MIGNWVRVALRDLRGDPRRFLILILCIALGVGAIAAVGSVGAALSGAIDRDSRVFLGGDFEISRAAAPANADELAVFAGLGAVSAVSDLNARGAAGDRSTFLSLKVVDAAYPLLGAVALEGAGEVAVQDLLADDGTGWGALVDAGLLQRLAISAGDGFSIAGGDFVVRGVIDTLPDQATLGFQLGALVVISAEAADAAGLSQTGVLAQYRYRVLLDGMTAEEAEAEIASALPEGGWETQTPEQAVRGISRFFEVFTRFLSLVGLAALLVGGLGVANAVAAYLTSRQHAIATLRSLGAVRARVIVHFLVQILVLGAIGIAIGLGLGALGTLLALPWIGGLLGLSLMPGIDVPSLALAAGFGVLIAFGFAWLPLIAAGELKPALLFRSASGAIGATIGWRQLVRPGTALPVLAAAGLVLLLAMATTEQRMLVLWYAGGGIAAFLLLRVAALGLRAVLRRLPRPRSVPLRRGLDAITRIGSPASTVIVSLGLGLSLVLLIASIDSNLRGQLQQQIAEVAPSFVLIDMQRGERDAITELAATDPRVIAFDATPLLRGSVTAIDGVPVAELAGEGRSPFDDEQTLTWSGPLPAGSAVSEGEWWDEDYAGAPLVSLDADLRERLDVGIGDSIEVAIAGRPIIATIASFRDVQWRRAGFNFMLVFSPGEVEAAPANYIATLKVDEDDAAAFEGLLAQEFPTLSFVAIGETLARVSGLLSSLANAVAVVGGLAVVSGVLVLAGALAAGRAQREADAVVMKVLGASRGDIALAYLVEYGLMGALATLLAAGIGSAAAWLILTEVLELSFVFDWQLVAVVLAVTAAITIGTGLATTWSALGVRPARRLRGA